MPVIYIETKIKAPKQLVFDLSRSIDLHKLSTSKTKEEAIAGRTTGLIEMGESVTWRAKHVGFYQTLESKITAFDKPNYFVDEMQKGIFKSFKHEHVFEESNGVTLMKDIFNYVAPLGIVGKIADFVFLEKYMRKFLLERNEMIKDFAESEKWQSIVK